MPENSEAGFPPTEVLRSLSLDKIPGMQVITIPFVPPVSLKVPVLRCPRFSFLMEFLSSKIFRSQ